jgi:hypothetical protein
VSPTSQTLEEVLDDAIRKVRSAPAGESRHAEFEGWYLQMDLSGVDTPSVIAPQRHEFSWSEDLSGELVVTAAARYTADGSPVSSGVSQAEGSVLLQEQYDAGAAPVLFATRPPSDVDELRSYLSLAFGEEAPDGAAYLSALRVLLSEWTPRPSVRVAMQELIQ